MKLQKATATYVEFKQSSGIDFEAGRNTLRQFERRFGDLDLKELRGKHISIFLDDPRIGQRTWNDKYFVLYRFFKFCYARHYTCSISMPERRKTVRFIFSPRLISRAELRRLIKAIPIAQTKRKSISPDTFLSLLLFLYGTGAVPREAIQVRKQDIDFKTRRVRLKASRSRGIREIPIGRDLCNILAAFCRRNPRKPSSLLFQTKSGNPLYTELLHLNFRHLLRVAGIVRPGGPLRQPRLFDLKHSFAVDRIIGWVKRGANMNRMMPALSVYLGFASLSRSEQYLRWVPQRFRRQINLIAKRTEYPTWRRNRTLMQYLTKL
jgi:integrase/recombinase XerD